MKKINIIYLLPEMKGASGGAKVIYNHSIKLNNFRENISSSVIHLKKKFSYKMENSLSKKFNIFKKQDSGWNPNKMKVSRFFSPNKKWFNKALNSKKELLLNKSRDFLIIPEIWSHFPEDLNLKKKGLIMQFLFKDFIT